MDKKIYAVLAVDKNGGIGLNDKLPWNCKEELNLFYQITKGQRVVFGRKTLEKLPKLSNRIIYSIGSTQTIPDINQTKKSLSEFPRENLYVKNFTSIKQAVTSINKPFYVCGGAQIYNSFIESDYVDFVYISVMKETYDCDTFIDLPFLFKKYVIVKEYNYTEFNHYILKNTHMNSGEADYLLLLQSTLLNGTQRQTRNGMVISQFAKTLEFDLTQGFPLLTTKKMFLRGIIEELLFFLRGETDTKLLESKNINVWRGNTSREFLDSHDHSNYACGIMGPMYGYQWRYFNSPYLLDQDGNPISIDRKNEKERGVDQLKILVEQIKTNPTSRRLLLTSYNPEQSDMGVLYPCHTIIAQFYVRDNFLDMICFNRSQDLFLGMPFNIASSSLLQIIIAKLTNKIPGHFTLHTGDNHIYAEHIAAVKEQLSRFKHKIPTIEITRDLICLDDINKLSYDDFKLYEYYSHPIIRAPMIP
jgi:dihydrofolate reductase/thymidylate synthase